MRNIGFTGHRDKRASGSQLEQIYNLYSKDAVWHWGAAHEGFDTQVERIANANKIELIPYYPKYHLFPPKQAPILRNFEIVDASDILVAFYDGRKSGGTHRTIEYAYEKGKQVHILSAKENN
jgi:hypothetical protein